MLTMCRRDQWKLTDLDWSKPPRELSREDEEAIVQYFVDMAQIELLAGELFKEQKRRAKDPRLKEIFATFVADEARHSAVATRLAAHYDVHKYRAYAPSRSLARFFPHFVRAVTYLSDEIANAYITGGELVLDVALLRSINDFVDDEMSEAAMELINRDESRHIAVDYHMVEYYASEAYTRELEGRAPRPLGERVVAAWTFASVLWYAAPFFREVFFEPMNRVDPTGKRIKEAMKRMQLLGAKPGVSERPFSRFMAAVRDAHNSPLGRTFVGALLARVAGVPPELLRNLYTDDEWSRASRMSFDELAADALAAKAV